MKIQLSVMKAATVMVAIVVTFLSAPASAEAQSKRDQLMPRPKPQKQPKKSPPPVPAGTPTEIDLPGEFRTIDGTGNNLSVSVLGSAGQPFLRLVPAAYTDGVSSPAGASRPSPRLISNLVAAQSESRPNRRGASDFIWQWGQFVDHDLDETPTVVPEEPLPIAVPLGDLQFDPTSTGTVTMPLNRSAYEVIHGVRQQVSEITAYIDASMVYGSDEATAFFLRALDGTGRLKVTSSDTQGDLLPPHPAVPGFFVAGDIRVNEQTGLIAIQTLFIREHNHWADIYKAANPASADEEVYQFARLIVSGEIQAITYREFLPVLLGPSAIPPYRGYKATVNPTIANEFATAAYRLGHSLLSPQLLRLQADGQPIAAGHLSLADSFFNPGEVTNHGIDSVLRGLAKQTAQELDGMIIDEVRNFLFGAPGAGGLDLASLNLQRGRDHGLPSYNAMRRALKLRPAVRFQDVNPNAEASGRLAAAYTSVEDIDLWMGALSEPHRPGAMVGEVIARIVADQFTRVRDGDRFWYQAHLPRELVGLVEQQSLATIIRRNTGIRSELQNNVFLSPVTTMAAAPGKSK
jgi:peroxidase